MTVLNVGLVGFGYWGPNLARNIAQSRETNLAAICELSPSRREAAASLFPNVELVEQFDRLLDNPGIEAIAIATPTSTHYQLAKRALLADKHVFVEKPLTDSAATSHELVKLASARSLVLHVDHTFVYTGAVEKLKDQVQSGALGDLLYFDSTRVNLGLLQPDVNVLWDLAVHDLSILQYVCNRMAHSVSATGTRHPSASQYSAAFMTLFYEDHFVAHIDVSWLSPVKLRRTLLSGTKKMVVYDDIETSEKLKIYDSGVDFSADSESIREVLVSYRTGDMVSPRISGHEALAWEVSHFADCVRQLKPTRTDGRLGAELVAILEAATESLHQRGAPITIKRGGNR